MNASETEVYVLLECNLGHKLSFPPLQRRKFWRQPYHIVDCLNKHFQTNTKQEVLLITSSANKIKTILYAHKILSM